MELCYLTWTNDKLINKLSKFKVVCKEPRNPDEYLLTIKKYYAACINE